MTPDAPVWFPPPPRPVLSAGHVHVWRLALDSTPAAVDALAALLSPDERARAAQLQRAGDGGRWAVARARLRQVLAAYTSCSPGALRFAVDEAGKPRLAGRAAGGANARAGLDAGAGGDDTASGDLDFNLSHCDGLALVAVAAAGRVGVDVEAVRPRPALAAIAARYFDPAEKAYLASLGEAARAEAFYALWTAKEAFTKAVGAGLSAGFRRFAVVVEADGALALGPGADRVATGDWTLCRLAVGPGHAAALAVDRAEVAVSCFDGPGG